MLSGCVCSLFDFEILGGLFLCDRWTVDYRYLAMSTPTHSGEGRDGGYGLGLGRRVVGWSLLLLDLASGQHKVL